MIAFLPENKKNYLEEIFTEIYILILNLLMNVKFNDYEMGYTLPLEYGIRLVEHDRSFDILENISSLVSL